jgi:hypothetical protein
VRNRSQGNLKLAAIFQDRAKILCSICLESSSRLIRNQEILERMGRLELEIAVSNWQDNHWWLTGVRNPLEYAEIVDLVHYEGFSRYFAHVSRQIPVL